MTIAKRLNLFLMEDPLPWKIEGWHDAWQSAFIKELNF